MEKIFRVLECTDHQKVTCATFMLQGEANMWWKTFRKILEAQDPVITWAKFLEALYENFFPESLRERKEVEFLYLTQGSDSVMAYKKKFEELAWFALAHIDTDAKKAKKFLRGLNPQLKGSIVVLKLRSYAEVLERALLLEDSQRGTIQGNSSKVQGKRPIDSQHSRDDRPQRHQRTHYEQTTQTPCRTCGKHHSGQCRQNSDNCYRCGG
ncbi:uncharacterized protein LOC122644895 [Telopea speciosissima]|uniref:uncharacterized protein LOC122644895 n=1 Tax=Telopea speciosissima TaxID=54955 RepID=UPI001CC6505B|nr:uncharacterized protein LOC122644895 [Telopea speciosissima]